MPQPLIVPDRDVPVLVVKVGHYPQHQGVVGAVRSFGRIGVPVYSMIEDRYTPTAVSRYLTGAFVRPFSGLEDPAMMVAALCELGGAIGRPAVALATDDEAAVLLAEHAGQLAEYFLLPPVPPALPRRLADKDGLYRICREQGVPTPDTWAPGGHEELLGIGRSYGYPLVLKNLEPFTRLRSPAVGHTTMVRDEAQLLELLPPGSEPSVLVQQYLPPEQAEDWFTHLVCPADGSEPVVFTGLKVRAWPPGAGVTSRARSLPNPVLAELAAGLCTRIGYRGVADLDWRLDRRDGRYKLVDFNPRTGAQFRLFETVDGLDVVRALHLDLTGRPVPRAPQLVRSFGVGQLDLPSAVAWTWRQRRLPRDVLPRRDTERSWLCRDDPMPAAVEAVRFSGTVGRRLRRAVRGRLRTLRPC